MSLRWMTQTVFGLGHMPVASGTWGSLPPPVVALAMVWLLGRGSLEPGEAWSINLVLVVLLMLFSAGCIAWGGWAERRYDCKDPGQVVSDEVAGQSLALLGLPWTAMIDRDSLLWNLALAGTAFLTFRLFDIVKPPPARGLQRLPAGWGILVDDLFAGVYALIATHLLVAYFWSIVLTVPG